MVSRVLLRKLRRDLWSRKGSLLTLVVIMAIGIGYYVGSAAVYRDLDGSRHRYYTEYQLADFTVDLKRAPEWAVDTASGLPNVRTVRGRVNMPVLIDLIGVSAPVSGTAISMPVTRTPVLNNILMRSGTWFSGNDNREVILNDAFARENRILPGHRIKVLLLDKQHELLVVGTAMSPEFVYLIPPGGALAPDPARFGVLYLPERFLQESCNLKGAYNQLIGKAHDNSRTALDNTLSLIARKLDAYGVANTTPVHEQMSVRFLADELTGLKVGAVIAPLIFLGVAALVLNILMGRMVTQQRPIIGTLRALGYSRGAITRHFLGFGIVVGISGAVTGILLGWWLQSLMCWMYKMFFALPSIDPHFYPDIFLKAIAISVGFSILGTIRGVRFAARLEPAEAMRPPPPEKGAKILLERIGFLWGKLTFRWKMVLRAIFRNPFRSTVCVLASLIATAIIFMAFSMVDSLNYLINYEFENISRQDFAIALRDPKGRRVTDEVKNIPQISEVEPQLIIACDLRNGPYRKRIGVTGIERGNRLYTPLDDEGRPISLPEHGLVLTKKLAEILNITPGQIVTLRPLVGRRQEVRAAVVGTVETFLGVSAYADISYLSRLIGEEWSANVVLSNKYKGVSTEKVMNELKKRPKVVGIGDRVRSLSQLKKTFGEFMGASIGTMVLFAGLIAFGSVLNAALVSLSEREREVGSLRVLGYTPGQVFGIFSGEAFLLNGIGIVLGVFGGIGLAYALSAAYSTELYRFPTIILPGSIILSVVIMMIFIGIAQLIVYRMIRRLNWLDVLKVKE